MTEREGGNAVPEADVSRRRGISPIWLIPIVAVVVAAGLAYEAITSRGPTITITFETAAGLEAGKSKVKFLNVEIGTVDAVEVRDLGHVEVRCSLNPSAGQRLRKGTQFWVVRPRIGAGGITGLGTIVSGAYITARPGPADAPAETEFVGLEDPPLIADDVPGFRIVLHADELGSLTPGAPIYFRQIEVGTVEQHRLSEDSRRIDVHAFIKPEYAHLVQNNSRFWDAGGVEVSMGPEGLDVKTASLRGLLAGGIAFDAPRGGKPADKDAEFWLHRSYHDVETTGMRYGGVAVIVETPQAGGVAVGDEVYYREVPVGSVVSHALSADGSTVRIRLNIARRYAPLVRSNTVFWNASGISADLGLTGLHIHAESLQSLLSGGIAFATPNRAGSPVKDGSVFPLHPEVKDEWLKWSPGHASKKKEGKISRFFHHHGKSEDEAASDHAPEEPKEHEEKHGFMRRLFGSDD